MILSIIPPRTSLVRNIQYPFVDKTNKHICQLIYLYDFLGLEKYLGLSCDATFKHSRLTSTVPFDSDSILTFFLLYTIQGSILIYRCYTSLHQYHKISLKMQQRKLVQNNYIFYFVSVHFNIFY